MGILGQLIMLINKFHGCAAAHEQVALISVKQVIYNKSVQLREFEEFDVKQRLIDKSRRYLRN